MGENGRKRGGNKGILAARRARRREEAEARQAAYAALTTEEKLTLIEQRPGESRRERERLGTEA